MKYIAFYDVQEYNSENRSVAPSAANVVNYMVEVMEKSCDIEIVSPSRTLNKSGHFKGRTTQISRGVSLTQPPTFGVKSKLGVMCSVLFTRLWMFLYLFFKLKKKETLVVYHSLAYMTSIRLLKKLKKLNLIMEVREIYSDVRDSYAELASASKRLRKKEIEYFSLADRYIFPTQMLNDLVNTENKPYLIATGIYRAEKRLVSKKEDGKTHVVYAGTLRPEKGSATAIELAKYLPENYHIHILGYGSDKTVEELKNIISNVVDNSKAAVTYEGLLRGEDFNRFLQSCHIGLATQDPTSSITDTSFPSKILTYLSNDLDVLCAQIPAVKTSPVGEYIYYYDEQTAEKIAKSIMAIDLSNSKTKRILLNELDKELKLDIKDLLCF